MDAPDEASDMHYKTRENASVGSRSNASDAF